MDDDAQDLARALARPTGAFLATASRAEVAADARAAAREAGCSPAALAALADYRFVDEVHEVGLGRYVRWARRGAGALTAGGVVVDLRFGATGTTVMVRGARGRLFQYRMDDCATFQKLSREEAWVLAVGDALRGDEDL